MVNVMDINLEYYRVFYQTALCGSLTQAARVLYSNQPNVTRTIHLLEQELGCSLFHRTNRGVTLTPEGELLLSHIAPAMEHIEQAQRELQSQQVMASGVLSLGVSEVALRCLVLPALRQFRSQYPGVQVRLSNNSTPQAIQALQEGLVDFSVVTTPVELPPGMEAVKLTDFREVVVCTTGLAGRLPSPLSPEELSRRPLISLGQDSATYRFYATWFAGLGLPFHPEVQTAAADQILPMVSSGLGIGFVPEAFLTAARDAGLSRLTLTQPIPKRSICLIRQNGVPLRLAAQRFQALLCNF